MIYKEKITEYIKATEGMDAGRIIKFAYREFGARITFATSLGEEDQVITDIISEVAPDIEIFTLDTGRLFQPTYDLLAKTQKRYPMALKVYYPDTEALEDMVRNQGINLFYESVENRRLCCGVRKVEPLKRALKDFDAWICGLRREQAVTRGTAETFEWDEFNQKVKINPLACWTIPEVRAYISRHRVDVNPLHTEGFVSIGCACCTRAVKPGEDIRAGRWWWEAPEHKECGLHAAKTREKLRGNTRK
jgi:phosphoadenosine phosphosulfate reductase